MSASWIAVLFAKTTVGMSALVLLFLVLRPLLRCTLGSRWLHVLWLLVLARLLLPWPVETRWSLIDRWTHSPGPVVEVASPQEVNITVSDAARLQSPVRDVAVVQRAERTTDWNHLLGMIWLGGAALGGILVLCQWLQTRRWAARTCPADASRLIEAFESIPAEWRADIELRQTDALPLATLAGVRKPQIWFPNRWIQELTTDEVRNVLLHELGHARRHDLLVQWLFSIALCLHWFNPLVWIAVRVARFDREMACDAWVLERSDENGAEMYGSTLLRIVQMLRTPARVSPAVVAMAASRRTLGIRIHQIGAFEQASVWRGVAGICAMLVAIAAVTTSRGSNEPTVGSSEQAGAPSPKITAELGAAPSPADSPVSAESTADSVADHLVARVEMKTLFAEVTASALADLSKGSAFLQSLSAVVGERASGITEDSDGLTPAQRVIQASVLSSQELSAIEPVLETKPSADFRGKLARETKGIDLLAAPRVTARSGQRANIEIIREYRYPTEFDSSPAFPGQWFPKKFETKHLGLTMPVTPTVAPDGSRITLGLSPEFVKLLGYKITNGEFVGLRDPEFNIVTGTLRLAPMKDIPDSIPRMPIISTRSLHTRIEMFSGQTVIVGAVTDPARVDANGKPVEGRVLLTLVTAKVLPAQTATAPARQESAAASPEPGNVAPVAAPEREPKILQEAIPVPEKPGFYRSPFSPDAGFVDLRGFPPGTEVKCPYSGKIFVVPPAENPKPKAKSDEKPVSENATPSDEANPPKDKPAGPEELPVNFTADEMSSQNGVTVARNHAVLRFKDVTMSADTITYDSVRKVAIGVDNVEVSSRGNTIKGVHIELDLKTTAVRTRGPSRTKIKDVAQ